jgi:hypothetical protein
MPSRLQDDLLHEFREEKRMIQSQIEEFQPLAVSLRKPAAQRLASKSLILLGELICWLLFLAAVAACIFLNRLYPFMLLFDLDSPSQQGQLGAADVHMLRLCVYGITALCGIGFLLLARSLARIRQKNDILNMAGGRIKTLVGQHLERKAAIDAVEQRHFGELPGDYATDVNAIPNPGYDAEEGVAPLHP